MDLKEEERDRSSVLNPSELPVYCLETESQNVMD